MKLANMPALGAGARKSLRVRVPPPAPMQSGRAVRQTVSGGPRLVRVVPTTLRWLLSWLLRDRRGRAALGELLCTSAVIGGGVFGWVPILVAQIGFVCHY